MAEKRNDIVKKMLCLGVVLYHPAKEEIEHLIEISSMFDDVYIYDNSPKAIHCAEIKHMHYFHHKRNDGISKAFNFMNSLAGKEYQYILLMDQDTPISKKNILDVKNFLEDAQRAEEYRKTAIFCPHIYFGNRPDKKCRTAVRDVKFAITSGSVMNLAIFHRLGGYDEDFFLDGADRDLCYRIIEHGYSIKEIGMIQQRQVLGTGKRNLLGIYEHSAKRNYYIANARRKFIWKHRKYYSGFRKVWYLYLSEAKQLASIIMSEQDKGLKLRAVWEGIRDFENGK